ncbi:MAG TPA: alcohol dehydrogenase catalytic domain-containing protein [Thermoanaerobaculia bacterium]|jgi:threonine dehydrogenase-like Zn-dependent dehydrogenase|nr:alcohol dehydrogenase catalytic domain-containing protein [Thermoanaerobaculia bacterium]
MRAVLFEGVRRLVCAEVADPQILDPGDAIVAVRASGVCGSDLHVYRGVEEGLDLGTPMGHELAGEVVAVGAEVQGLRPGDRVASPFSTSCGVCLPCRRGLTARCVRGELFGWVHEGQGLAGAQAELVRVPLASSTLVPIPDELPFEIAVLAGDVLATGAFGAEQAGAGPGAILAVVGCGPVGLMAILGALELGAERVFALDTVTERLALAESYGGEPVPLSAHPVEWILDATSGAGVDGVAEAVGTAAALQLAYSLVRPGGAISALGVHNEPAFALAPGQLYDKNLTYRTGRCPARAYMDRLLPIAARRAGDLARMISHRLPLSEGPHGYDLFDRRAEGCTKVMLLP